MSKTPEWWIWYLLDPSKDYFKKKLKERRVGPPPPRLPSQPSTRLGFSLFYVTYIPVFINPHRSFRVLAVGNIAFYLELAAIIFNRWHRFGSCLSRLWRFRLSRLG